MYYINHIDDNIGYTIETIDYAKDYEEALYLLREYKISDASGKYKISKRPTKCWVN